MGAKPIGHGTRRREGGEMKNRWHRGRDEGSRLNEGERSEKETCLRLESLLIILFGKKVR